MQNSCTCIIVDDERDAIELLENRLGHLFKSIEVIATFTDWEEALEGLRRKKCDILFLDISMPGKNALQLLKLLPGLDCEIIFVTAHEEYALDAFSYSTSGYILKPIDDAELSAAINKAVDRVKNKKIAQKQGSVSAVVDDKIGISHKQGIDYISIRDILYLESTNKCTKIVTVKGEYTSSLNIGRFTYLTDNHPFFQVHRSYIINLNCIVRYESAGLLIMSNKKEIPVSRAVRNDFLKLFSND